jgi:beta-glucanase (GH16 family)
MKRTFLFPALLFLFSVSCEDKETTITNFTLDKYQFTEGSTSQAQSVTVTVEGEINSTVQVHYELMAGSAKEGVDYTFTEGVLEFSAGKKQATFTFNTLGDTHLELIEELGLMLEYGGTQFFATIAIVDDDPIEPILTNEEGFYTPATYPSMQLKWADEFEGASLNTSSWTYELGNGCNIGLCGWGNNELEVYTDKPENIKLENGKLLITARKEAGGGFTSARIKTENKRELKYGRIDVRAKLPKGQGIWPAIWALGENIDLVSWPACGEIDIMELVGHQPATVHGTVHYNNDGYKTSSGSTTLASGDFSDKFHVFSIVWDFNTITWYVDNVEFKKFNNSNMATWPFNKPFYFIMNVAVGGNWPGPPDNTTIFPQQMQVDYIRVFQ